MMKRLAICILCLLSAVLLMPVLGVGAAEKATVVYLKDKGTGDGSSSASPVGTLKDAFDALDLTQDCTVVICGPFTQNANFKYSGKDYSGSVTFTSVYGGRDHAKTSGAVLKVGAVQFACSGKTEFCDIKIEVTGSNFSLIGRHHPVKMGENVTVSGSKLKGGNTSNSFCIYGGSYSGYGDPATSAKDTSITVLSGANYYLVPFTRGIKANCSGTAFIKVGGTDLRSFTAPLSAAHHPSLAT